MAFDVEGARKAGYSDAEIAKYLAAQSNFDLSGAKSSGYSDSEVIAHLAQKTGGAASTAENLAAITAGAQTPGDVASSVAAQRAQQPAPEPTLMERAIGAGEAALTTGTGLVGGTFGGAVGLLQGIANELRTGTLGSQDAANRIEQKASEYAQALTIAPRTEQGMESVRAVGETLAPLAALGPAPGAIVGPGIASTTALARTGAAAALEKAATAAPAALRRTPPTVAQVPAQLPPGELAQVTRRAAQGGFGSQAATKQLAAQAAPDAETLAAADRLGITEYLQPDHYTSNQAFRQLAQLVKSQTGSEAYAAQREGLLKVAQRADDLVTEIGGTGDLSTLSESLRSNMISTVDKLKSSASAEFDKVAAAVPKKTPVQTTDTLSFIKQRADELGGVENLSTTERTLLSKLSPKSDGSLPTYALLDDVRKGLNEAKYGKGETAFQGASGKLMDDLINSLRSDQARAAEAAGQGATWERAQALSRQYKGVQDDLAAIFGKQLDQSLSRGGQAGLTGAVGVLGKGNVSPFVRLIQAVPQDMRQQVTASGLASFFQKTTRGGEMDFAGYANWFDGLQKNKQAYAAIMSNLPQHSVRQLADIARVSRGIAESKSQFIATGKAINPKALQSAESLVGRIYDEVMQRGATGLAAEAVGTVSGAPGFATLLQSAVNKNRPSIMQAADKLIVSPEFVEAVRSVGTPAQKRTVSSLAYSKDFNKFVRALGRPPSMSNREQWILQALEAQAIESQNQTVH